MIHKAVLDALENWAKLELDKLNVTYSSNNLYFTQLQNFLSKEIKLKPRKFSISNSFKVPDEHKSNFDELCSEILQGNNLNEYLSRATNDASYNDDFLNLYGLHHFHFKKSRSGYLALALVNDSEVFFVEVKQHGNKDKYVWTSKSVLEILHKERPDLISHLKANTLNYSMSGISKDEDIKSLQINRYSFFIALEDGSIYLPSKLGKVSTGNDSKYVTVSDYLVFLGISRSIESKVTNHLIEYQKEYSYKIFDLEIYDINLEICKRKSEILLHQLNFRYKFKYKINSNTIESVGFSYKAENF